MSAPSALLVSYSGAFGGAERLLRDLAPGLPGETTIACPEGPLAEAARAAGLRVFTIRTRRMEARGRVRDRAGAPLRLAAQAREVRGLVRALGPDVVVAWGMRAGITCAAALTGGARGRPALVLQHNDFVPAGRGAGAAIRAAARRADRVLCVSRAVARDLDPAGALGERLAVSHPAVDLDAVAPSAMPEQPVVVILGALVGWKRVDLALEAVAIAARSIPELRLRVVGAALGQEGAEVERRLRERAGRPDLTGHVELAGPVASPAVALAGARCLLHCAEREPFGLVVAEALAAGRPAVAPAAGGPAEIVDESCGRLYAPGDPAAAAAALVVALEAAPELGGAGRARAERLFGLRAARERLAGLVGRVAAGAAPSRSAGATRGEAPLAGTVVEAPPAGAGVAVPGEAPPAGAGVAVVTVAHNSERHLARLLDSLARHLPGARVVVVDSGSADGSAALARERGADVVELGRNVGYGRGSNAGIARVKEPVTVVLNPDVELVDGSLAALAREAAGGPARILAPLVLRPDGSRQDTAQRAPGTLAAALIAVLPPAALPGPLRERVAPWLSVVPRRVAWAVGCCLVARTEVLRRLGPFDERIFLYAEDLELGLRAARNGVETWFRPDARVIHHSAHSTMRAFEGEAFDLLARQRRAVVHEFGGARAATLDDTLQALTFSTRALARHATGGDPARERLQLAALRRARRERPRLDDEDRGIGTAA